VILLLVLITYDVNTETLSGRKRLRQIAKTCTDYGQRVQNSVFECNLDSTILVNVKAKLLKIMDKDKDSIRFYSLGNNYKNNVEHYGAKVSFDVTEPLII
jgi:CRISPR-associated protein Cas2